eukprot:4579358-Pyramimonas_sp.AAC.1
MSPGCDPGTPGQVQARSERNLTEASVRSLLQTPGDPMLAPLDSKKDGRSASLAKRDDLPFARLILSDVECQPEPSETSTDDEKR